MITAKDAFTRTEATNTRAAVAMMEQIEGKIMNAIEGRGKV